MGGVADCPAGALALLLFLVAWQPVSTLFFRDSGSRSGESVVVRCQGDYEGSTAPYRPQAGMPSVLTSTLVTGGREVTLRLTSRPDANVNLPLYLMTSQGQIEADTSLPQRHDCGVYVEESTGATFIVRRLSPSDQRYELMGTLRDGGALKELWPLGNQASDSNGGVLHVVRDVSGGNFRSDAKDVEELKKALAENGLLPTSPVLDTVPTDRSPSMALLHDGSDHGHTVELFLISDHQDFQNFKSKFLLDDEGTRMMMRLWYAFVSEGVRYRYESFERLDPSVSVSVNFVGLLIIEDPEMSTWGAINVQEGTEVLTTPTYFNFTAWKMLNQAALPPADHYMAMTGYDLRAEERNDVLGVAFLGQMCSVYSTSIIENRFLPDLAVVVAHELAHSMSAVHDADTGVCRDEDHYIMAAFLSVPPSDLRANPWIFSPCTRSDVTNFLNNNVTCTRQERSEGTVLPNQGERAGQVYPADRQCQVAFGTLAVLSRADYQQDCYSSLCFSLNCKVPGQTGSREIFPWDYTTCGDRKWCLRGFCVYSDSAPSVPDGCPQGDDPNYGCDVNQCDRYTVQERQERCCKTCSEDSICRLDVTSPAPAVTSADLGATPGTTSTDSTSQSTAATSAPSPVTTASTTEGTTSSTTPGTTPPTTPVTTPPTTPVTTPPTTPVTTPPTTTVTTPPTTAVTTPPTSVPLDVRTPAMPVGQLLRTERYAVFVC